MTTQPVTFDRETGRTLCSNASRDCQQPAQTMYSRGAPLCGYCSRNARFQVVVTQRYSAPDGRSIACRWAIADRTQANRTLGRVFVERDVADGVASAMNAQHLAGELAF